MVPLSLTCKSKTLIRFHPVRLVDYGETVEPIEYEFMDALYLTPEWRSGPSKDREKTDSPLLACKSSDGAEKVERLPLLARYFREALGLCRIHSFIVEHSYPTFAGKGFLVKCVLVNTTGGRQLVVMEHESGWKLAYSGDTRPCEKMAKMAQGADILIHEATFDEDMQQKAINDRHSTVREALRIAQDAKPMCTVLTHFSARFEKTLPNVREAQQAVQATAVEEPVPVLLAQDFMTLPLPMDSGALCDVVGVMQPLHHLFAQEASS